jgi:hypothetical protein
LTHRTAISVGPQHSCPEDRLVEPGACEPLNVGSLQCIEGAQIDEPLAFVYGNAELQFDRVFCNEPDRIPRYVDPPSDSDEIGKREAFHHGLSQRPIVRMVGIATPILVVNQAVVTDIIFVLGQLIERSERGANRNGCIKVGGLPDPRLDNQAESPSIECEGIDGFGRQRTIWTGGQQSIEMAEDVCPELGIILIGETRHMVVVPRRGVESAVWRR